MILGIGIDLCRIDRIRRSVTRFGKAWLDEICAEAEQVQLEREADIAEAVAIVFSLKEAASKPIGTGFANGVQWRDFLVEHSPTESKVRLSGVAAQRLTQLRPRSGPVEVATAFRTNGVWVSAVCLITIGSMCSSELLQDSILLPLRDPRV